MATEIESLLGVTIQSDFFAQKQDFYFFPEKKKRIAIVYGHNGSGKSTIAQGFREWVERPPRQTVTLSPIYGSVSQPSKGPARFFVFDEKYVETRVKMQPSGLGTIVLFGKQIQLEQQIRNTEEAINEVGKKIASLQKDYERYTDYASTDSPGYWLNRAIEHLQKGGWAYDVGREIKGNATKAAVNEVLVRRLGDLQPDKKASELRDEFTQLLTTFKNATVGEQVDCAAIQQIAIGDDVETTAVSLLALQLQRPELTPREKNILDVLNVGLIVKAKSFLEDSHHKICPTCLQTISDEYRADTKRQIEEILNREVEDFTSRLRDLNLCEIPENLYQAYRVVDAGIYDRMLKQIQSTNRAIKDHNAAVQNKIADPFSVMSYDRTIGITSSYQALNSIIEELRRACERYNEAIRNKTEMQRLLIELRDEIAHYEIEEYFKTFLRKEKERCNIEAKKQELCEHLSRLRSELCELNAQRKNFSIAADKINQYLEYIFLAKGRLCIELGEDQLYHVKSYGNDVSPEQLSCGERNAMALCYYFTEIAKGSNLEDMYKAESLLVIDDPVSSFDLDNRVGIISFLRLKLLEILGANPANKVLVLTHDISVMFGLQKAVGEVCKTLKARGGDTEHNLFSLREKRLDDFSNKHNEYTELLKIVYNYAKKTDSNQEYVIGNVIRRVLEAFATFSFKKSIDAISYDEKILEKMPNEAHRIYFRNFMYRLTLNGESHFEEAIRGEPETSFFSRFTTEEKQRVAQDILCFMYNLNSLHILSHLPDAKSDLVLWCKRISETFKTA